MDHFSIGDDRLNSRQRLAQLGASALEFALVFPLFFLILYMAIAYGLIFAAQQSMNYAAETWARDSLVRGNLASEAVSTRSVDWLRSMGGSAALSTECDADTAAPALGQHEIKICIQYDYLNHPLVPNLGPQFFSGILFPEKLVATAIVDHEIAGSLSR
ncbi:pilus assembly protein [Paenalcaligenes niemegkensis]|uniref:TadE family protein n=1 Tax=Paenalcaligenes niemegkensis TaxID=2895469 RepID=UPI001EE9AEA9|nr:TadE family protein [Paenalcaligenes niemegkensis]MCQ9616994.1 pilus assembly protein [Paenalcaligenes niemegkensis]